MENKDPENAITDLKSKLSLSRNISFVDTVIRKHYTSGAMPPPWDAEQGAAH